MSMNITDTGSPRLTSEFSSLQQRNLSFRRKGTYMYLHIRYRNINRDMEPVGPETVALTWI